MQKAVWDQEAGKRRNAKHLGGGHPGPRHPVRGQPVLRVGVPVAQPGHRSHGDLLRLALLHHERPPRPARHPRAGGHAVPPGPPEGPEGGPGGDRRCSRGSATTGTSWTSCGSACTAACSCSSDARPLPVPSRPPPGRRPGRRGGAPAASSPWPGPRRPERPPPSRSSFQPAVDGRVPALGQRRRHPLRAPALVVHRPGRALFAANCSSCHGTQAAGTTRAPNLQGLGSGTVDFWVSTGRMPLAATSAQATRKPSRFNRRQTLQIAAYVHSFTPGQGVQIPLVATGAADLANRATPCSP